MAGTITIEPSLRGHRRIDGSRLIVIVGPQFDSQRLASELVGWCARFSPGTIRVITLDGAIPLWRALVDFDHVLTAGTWDLYDECLRDQERRRAERLAELERALAHLPAPTIVASEPGSLRTVLRQTPHRWPGSTVLVAGQWRRLPWRWPGWSSQIQLLVP